MVSLIFEEYEEYPEPGKVIRMTEIYFKDTNYEDLIEQVRQQLDINNPSAFTIRESKQITMWGAAGLGYDILLQLKSTLIDNAAALIIGYFIKLAQNKYCSKEEIIDQNMALMVADSLLRRQFYLKNPTLVSIEMDNGTFALMYAEEGLTYKVEVRGNGNIISANRIS